jgi:hypothetical protein
MSGVPPENEVRVRLNRSAVVVKPQQPFLYWLRSADPTSVGITLDEVAVGFDVQYRSMLIDQCDEPRVDDSE